MVGSALSGHARRSQLGWVPEPGVHAHNVWNTQVDDHRRRPRAATARRRRPGVPVIAVGDSFTFGDEVGRRRHLAGAARAAARRAGRERRRVRLRPRPDRAARRAAARRGDAAALVVNIVPNDVLRCEYAYRYAWKPWFAVKDGALLLQGVPVPCPDRAPPTEPLPRRWLRWSFLADLVYRRLDPDDWLLPDSLRVHRRGVEVGALLIERLDALSRASTGAAGSWSSSWYPARGPGRRRCRSSSARARSASTCSSCSRGSRPSSVAGGATLPDLYQDPREAGAAARGRPHDPRAATRWSPTRSRSGCARSASARCEQRRARGLARAAEDPALYDLYTAPTPNGWKASIMLEELGVPYAVQARQPRQDRAEGARVSAAQSERAHPDAGRPRGRRLRDLRVRRDPALPRREAPASSCPPT